MEDLCIKQIAVSGDGDLYGVDNHGAVYIHIDQHNAGNNHDGYEAYWHRLNMQAEMKIIPRNNTA